MERLDLKVKPAYSLEEAAIHQARYANILNYIKDKTVLDLACGEGYGSALLMQYGAKKVVGVDISVETIEKAKQLFSETGAEYIAGDAQTVADILGDNVFDVVVSIETIEHVHDPLALLETMKKVAKKDAIFYITCPNDYWYYPKESESNPYHIKKYKFEEFKKITQAVLGDDVKWGLGSTVWGFGTAPLENSEYQTIGSSWMKSYLSQGGLITNNDTTEALNETNCSFYCGIWNTQDVKFSSGIFPLGMDAYNKIFEAVETNVSEQLKMDNESLRNEILSVRSSHDNLRDRVLELERAFKRKELLLQVSDCENKVLKESIFNIDQQNNNLLKHVEELNIVINEKSRVIDEMKIGYYRYLRMSKYVPKVFKTSILKFYRALKG